MDFMTLGQWKILLKPEKVKQILGQQESVHKSISETDRQLMEEPASGRENMTTDNDDDDDDDDDADDGRQ